MLYCPTFIDRLRIVGVGASFGSAWFLDRSQIVRFIPDSSQDKFAAEVISWFSVSILAGVYGSNLLHVLVRKLNKDLSLDVETIRKSIDKREQFNERYAQAISIAENLLDVPDGTIDSAAGRPVILELESLLQERPLDRRLNIFVGRIYRRMGKYNEAIVTLRTMLEVIAKSRANNKSSDLLDLLEADGRYNIACYHALKGSNSESSVEKDRLFSEALLELAKSIELLPYNRHFAATDPDMKILLSERKKEMSELGISG